MTLPPHSLPSVPGPKPLPPRRNFHRRHRPFKVAAAAVDREGETWMVESFNVGGVGGERVGCECTGGPRVSLGCFLYAHTRLNAAAFFLLGDC